MHHYQIASWVISKVLGLSYFVAFLSLSSQVLGLYGQRGILSIDHLLNILDQELGANRFRHFPSIFWLASSDGILKFTCLLGMLASSLAVIGFSQSWMFLLCWILYLSFVSCGQVFLSYQWDILLLELGFLGLFFAPYEFKWQAFASYELHPVILGLVWILLFKLMFSSGVVKLTNKDADWKNLTALRFHYWTQPLPNPVAYIMAKAPLWFQRFSTALMFFIELIVPFFIFIPGKTAFIAAGLLILLQALIITTGNFAFFNLITLGLCLSIISDSFWIFTNTSWVANAGTSDWASAIAVMILIPANIFWILKTLFEKSKALDFMLPYMRALYPLRISNPYGLFAVMTKSRPELILEGSVDGQHWQEYEFKHKAGNLHKAPTFVAPFQPRLDWQMWFAALETFNENLWLQNLAMRIFEESTDVHELLAKDPFHGKSPKYLRYVKYNYQFSSFDQLKKMGQWWTRNSFEVYSPTFARDDF